MCHCEQEKTALLAAYFSSSGRGGKRASHVFFLCQNDRWQKLKHTKRRREKTKNAVFEKDGSFDSPRPTKPPQPDTVQGRAAMITPSLQHTLRIWHALLLPLYFLSFLSFRLVRKNKVLECLFSWKSILFACSFQTDKTSCLLLKF